MDSAPQSFDEEIIDKKQSPCSLLVRSVQFGSWNEFNIALRQTDNPMALVRQEHSDGTTALHWASLNTRLGMIAQLLRLGSLPNVLGGPDNSTPLHWASTKDSIRTIFLLLQHGADISISDKQGYSPAHIATQHQHSFLVLLFLHMGFPPDQPDLSGRHTILHWAIFRRAPLELFDILLQYAGPKIFTIADNSKKTPLHWAAQLGHYREARWLLENGSTTCSDLTDIEGNTPLDLAIQNNNQSWYIPMEKQYKLENSALTIKRKEFFGSIGKIIAPISFPLIMSVFVYTNWIFGLISLFLIPYLAFSLFPKLITGRTIRFGDTCAPFFINISGMIIGGFVHSIIILPKLFPDFLVSSTIMIIFYISTIYYLLATATKNPGYIELPDSIQIKKTVFDLASQGLLDSRHYCITCKIRKPLRSKHCRICNRCVAKMDHHCPWTWNCIGEANYFSFFMYILTGFVFTILSIYLNIHHLITEYYEINEALSLDSIIPCIIWSNRLCHLFNIAPWSFCILIVTISFIPWMFMILLSSHIYQICKALTSNELSNSYRLEYFYPTVMELVEYEKKSGKSLLPRTLPIFDMNICESDDPEWIRSWPLHKRPYSNPFDGGTLYNCLDFFCRKNGIHVDTNYYKLYERPMHCIHKQKIPYPLSCENRTNHCERENFLTRIMKRIVLSRPKKYERVPMAVESIERIV